MSDALSDAERKSFVEKLANWLLKVGSAPSKEAAMRAASVFASRAGARADFERLWKAEREESSLGNSAPTTTTLTATDKSELKTHAKKILREIATRAIAHNRPLWDELKSDFQMGANPDLCGSYLGSAFAAVANREIRQLPTEDQVLLADYAGEHRHPTRPGLALSAADLVVGEIMLRAQRVAARWVP
jgi:hypothetical protein